MPFKSEKQRKYLWANEPEIARDWTETYGSKVKKADGGISQLVKSGPGRPGYRGSPHDDSKTGSGTSSGGNYGGSKNFSGGNQGNNQGSDRGHSRFKADSGYYGHTGGVNPNEGWQKDVKNIEMARSVRPYHHLISDKATQYLPSFLRKNPNFNSRTKFLKKEGLLKEVRPGMFDTEDESLSWVQNPDILTSQWGLDRLRELGYVPNSDLHGKEKGGGGDNPYIYPYEMASAPIEEEEIEVADVGLGSGHFRLPERFRLGAATGGLMDIVDRESIIKTPDEEIVTNQMEEIEGQTAGGGDRGWQAQMLAEEMAYSLYGKEFYDLSNDMQMEIYGKALHEIDEMLLGMAQGGRVPAAFGGIMDTSTGRRGYFLGSVGKAVSKPFKKAAKAVKKLISSPIGKLALMYAAGTYLGGTQALGGTGKMTFAQRLKDPKLLGNLLKPKGWSFPGAAGTGESTARELAIMKNAGGTKAPTKSLLSKGLGFLQDHPMEAIVGTSLGAGLLTDKMPVEELDQADDEYDAEKEAFDAYLASLGGSYRVPEQYRLAKGGRVAAQEGGLMNLGGMEKDYRNDGGFVPIGGEEKADDVPARLSRNEFVFTADAVRSAGGGDIDKGAEVMENVMKNLEQGGTVSEESQGKGGAQDMFEVSERLSEVM